MQHAERVQAQRLIMVAPDEWANGNVRVKTLETRVEEDVPVSTFD